MILYNNKDNFNNNFNYELNIINHIDIQIIDNINIEFINKINIEHINNINLDIIYNNKLINNNQKYIDNYSVCFIIASKYYRSYVTYLKFYVDNIINFYTNYLIIIVNNNSIYIDDVIQLFNQINYKNVIILNNNIDCKFELGAYKVGILYLLKNNLINNYDYHIFIQDTFVLKNKYDFNILKYNNIYACPINEHDEPPYYYPDITQYAYNILKEIKLFDNLDKITFCWCHSFILHKTKLIDFYNYVKDIIIINRFQSECSERYLPRILYELNNHKNYNIDGFLNNIKYNSHDKYINSNIFSYFEKKLQSKTEKTIE
jgi:hypothetical protein